MWSDNEADLDLLGFEHLVNSLAALLGNSHLLPLTVGVNGDWGSGKSSLMRMTANQLRKNESEFSVVEFSPWLHEDRQDVKSALIVTILEEITPLIPDGDRQRLNRLWTLLRAVVLRSRGAVPTIVSATTGLAGAPPDVALAAGELAGGLASAFAGSQGEQTSESQQLSAREDLLAPREFQSLFARVVSSLEGRTIVVFVDDLDRCLPDTVVDTLEAIRLFLSAPGTAFVVAAHRQMVEAAINRRYPMTTLEAVSIGRDYLEKMFQVNFHLPPLSEPEAETYLVLLLCQLHLEPQKFKAVVQVAATHYREGRLPVALNEGMVSEVLADVPEALAEDLQWVTSIAPAIGGGLRGNPRQLKRFLNTLRLRSQTSDIRGISLDHAVLAKLMVLEEVGGGAFATLFGWQMESRGKPPQIATSEARAVAADPQVDGSQEGTDEAENDDVAAWRNRATVTRWLTLEPSLTDLDLGPYFHLVRDRFAPGEVTSRLPASLQQLVGELGAPSPTMRRSAVSRALSLPTEEIDQVSAALADRARRSPRDPSADSLIEMATDAKHLQTLLASTLKGMSVAAVPARLPPVLLVRFGEDFPPEIGEILDAWEAQQNSPQLSAAVTSARRLGTS